MNPSDSIMNVTVWSLRSSVHPEDNKTAAICERLLADILTKLKPILRYVCAPREFYVNPNMGGVRCLLLGTYKTSFESEKDTPTHVFLSETGAFFSARAKAILMAEKSEDLVILCHGNCANSGNVWEMVRDGESDKYCTWNQLPFLDLIKGLGKTLAEAEERQREHLALVAKQRQLLDKLAYVLQEDG